MSVKQPLVVFSDDWGRHPSSCQHLVSHMLETFDVTWVNTIGTRLPSLDPAAIYRSIQKIREWTMRKPVAGAAKGPRVLSPIMWPTFRTQISRALNRRIIGRQLLRHVAALESSIVLTTIPVVADLIGKIPASRWVYYCVDDFSEWPGLDGQTLRVMEERLIDSVDGIVAAGDRLAERIRKRGRTPMVLSHGVDLAHWSTASYDPARVPGLSDLGRPIVMFWGLVDPRLNVDWLCELGRTMDRGSIVLVGPEQNASALLTGVPRIVKLGPLAYRDLPIAAAAADVLIMPYADLPVTRAMQPLKLKEYLATGKPVVTSRLPSVVEWEDCLDVADTAQQFAMLVVRRLKCGVLREQTAARARLMFEDWESKALSMKEFCMSRRNHTHLERTPVEVTTGR